MNVIHNIPVHVESGCWYLCHGSTSNSFVFLHCTQGRDAVRGPLLGWTWEDAVSFHNMLMDRPGGCKLYKLPLDEDSPT